MSQSDNCVLPNCSIGVALSLKCSHKSVLFSNVKDLNNLLTPINALKDEEKEVLLLRSGIVSVVCNLPTPWTVCEGHKNYFLRRYVQANNYCCDPTKRHFKSCSYRLRVLELSHVRYLQVGYF